MIDLGTPSLRRRVLEMLPSPKAKEMAHVVDTLSTKAEEIVASRKAELASSGEDIGAGKDILSILCELSHLPFDQCVLSELLNIVKANVNASEEDRLPDEEVVNNVGCVIGSLIGSPSSDDP